MGLFGRLNHYNDNAVLVTSGTGSSPSPHIRSAGPSSHCIFLPILTVCTQFISSENHSANKQRLPSQQSSCLFPCLSNIWLMLPIRKNILYLQKYKIVCLRFFTTIVCNFVLASTSANYRQRQMVSSENIGREVPPQAREGDLATQAWKSQVSGMVQPLRWKYTDSQAIKIRFVSGHNIKYKIYMFV